MGWLFTAIAIRAQNIGTEPERQHIGRVDTMDAYGARAYAFWMSGNGLGDGDWLQVRIASKLLTGLVPYYNVHIMCTHQRTWIGNTGPQLSNTYMYAYRSYRPQHYKAGFVMGGHQALSRQPQPQHHTAHVSKP